MALGVDRAIAELIRDGDPQRGIDGLATLQGYGLYDDPDPAKKNIWLGEEPPEPDDVVNVVLEGGAPPVTGSDPVGRRPAFTVRCRAQTYEKALGVAHQVHAILEYFGGTIRGIPFFRVLAAFEPIPLGRDRDERGGRWVTSQTYNAVTRNFVLS